MTGFRKQSQRADVQFDGAARSVRRGDRQTRLPHKVWQVLELLREAAPAEMTRAELIDQVWRGNHYTGQKGLTQAIWAIRAALGDDPRRACFIQTVPGSGYRWIEGDVKVADASAPSRRRALLAGSVAASLLALTVSWLGASREPEVPTLSAEALVDARLYREGQNLVLALAQGCRRILAPSTGRSFGDWALSGDGQRVIFELKRGDRCELIEFDLLSNERRDLSACFGA